MFVFFHGYSPDTWDAMLRSGLVGDGDGIRFQQSIRLDEEMKFNRLARKGGKLYGIIKERGCPFYVDRLQGGDYIQDYVYDKELLDEYRRLLGDKFFGFQMHEWLSNYNSDANKKLKELLTKRNLLGMAVAALILTTADMLLKTWYEPYEKVRSLILLVLALVLLSLLAWRILYKRKKPEPEAQEAVYEIV